MIDKIEGLKVANDDIELRIIYDDGEICIVCQINTTKLVLNYYSATDMREQIRNGYFHVVEEAPVVFDVNSMKPDERKRYEQKKALVSDVAEIYGPGYIGLLGKGKKPEVDTLLEKHQIKRFTFWKTIREYLQSGCQLISLLDNRSSNAPTTKRTLINYEIKTGRPTKYGLVKGVVLSDELRERFDEFLERYKKGREQTFKNAYIGLTEKYYSEMKNGVLVPLPESQRPTYKQFYYYCHKHLTGAEMDEIKTSRMEARNAKRLLLSSARKDAIRPGWICEVDALEVDLSITSVLNPDQAVGRPIVYFMVDVYSSMIVAASVSFENNSMIGLTNLLTNLADDKTEYCKKHGFSVDGDAYWKSCFIPHELRCDRGSDFMSNKFEEICERLGIIRTLEPPGMGSMKGIVEQSFHQFQSTFRPLLEKNGLITKRYDSNHHREAMLNIENFEQMLITFILEHNRKTIENYPMSKQMIKENITPSPVNLWEYGCEKFGSPVPITSANRSQFIYDLMPEVNASLSRKGITYKDLVYINNETALLSKMYDLGTKRTKFPVRYDPRNVSHVYYIGENNKLCIATLNEGIPNMSDFADLTWFEYEEILEAKKEILADGKSKNFEIDFDQYRTYSAIIDAAYTPVFANTKNLREARKAEKQAHNSDNSLSEHIEAEDKKGLPEVKAKKKALKKKEEGPLLPDKKKEQEIVIKSKPKPVEEDDFDPDDIDFEKALEDFEENK